ncbi:MAG: hypothetical protein AVDCRST_MAG93-7007 [uncultured Chloroflexia bacterium]|uniref:Uncharacterized protein n=1 Tax=uncultured Chloroflexia bacterium TaxID=1672391 RepID=A0A6J4M3G2_9CHLR|nr:MAG: hypothetical protein AVDCRST_MAG93-7007 [uncultured Chloroflexia bacterium]
MAMKLTRLLETSLQRRQALKLIAGTAGTLTLAAALVACGGEGKPGGGPGGLPADAPTALVHGPLSSPVVDELRKTARLVPYDGSQKVADHDMVVFDGDSHTSAALTGDALLASALRAGKWVLGVDVNESHKRGALGPLLDFASHGTSPGYFVRTELDMNGQPLVVVLEYPKTDVALPSREPREPEAPVTPLVTRSPTAISPTPAATAAFVNSVVGKLELGPARARPQQVGDPQFPAGLIYKTFFFSEPVLFTSPPAHKPVEPRPTQTGLHSLNYTVYIFLDNRNEPQGNFQYVLAELDGEANPTNGTGQFANIYYDEMAWFQSRYLMHLWPADDALFQQVASSPETVNNVTSVTTGVSFSIGYNQAQGATGNFTYSNSQTRNITDWKLTNQSAGNRVGWYYRSENPFSVDAWLNNTAPTQYNGFYASSYPAEPNDLALNQLQVHAQAVWKTQSVLDRWVEFDYHREYQLVDLYCSKNFGDVCIGDKALDRGDSVLDNKFSINLGAVVPIPIQALAFSPNPVKAGQPAAGTVTLARPAQTDTVIALSSNSPNVSVLPTVTVPKGQTSATFQVLTSSNGGAPGSSFQVTITALYVQDYQAQLTVQN